MLMKGQKLNILAVVMIVTLWGCSGIERTDNIDEVKCPEIRLYGEDRVNLNFENGTLDEWSHHFPHSEAARVVKDPEDPDNNVVRFKLEEGEVFETRSGEFYRSELYERYKAPLNKNMRYSFRVYITDEWEVEDTRALIAQWHGTPDLHLGEISRSPNLGIEYREDKFLIRMNTSKERVNRDNKTNIKRETLYLSEKLEINRWYDFVVEVKWTHEDDGYYNIWIDDEQVVEYRGGTAYNDCYGPYFKMGIYRDDTPKTFVIYHDNYKRELVDKE